MVEEKHHGKQDGAASNLQADSEGDSRAEDTLEKLTVADDPTESTGGVRVGSLCIGQVLAGRFRIIRLLGRGGMGYVYEAKDLDLGMRVALKTIRPEIACRPRSLARFKREIQLARRVTHPNVCRIFDLGRHCPGPEAPVPTDVITFLTMELLEGETLAARLRRKGRIAKNEALPLVLQMAEALAAAHDIGVVHRDFKPSNVMLVPSKSAELGVRAVVTDFGLARGVAAIDQASDDNLDPSANAPGRVVGTPAYMAPEQWIGAEVTTATDIFALGLVMYEIATGSRPFPDNLPISSANIVTEQLPPSPRVHAPDLDSHWEQVILRCLEVRPAKRFADARSLVAELTGRPLASPEVSPAPAQLVDASPGEHSSALGKRPHVVFPWKRLLTTMSIAITICLVLLLWYLRANGWMTKLPIPAGSSVLVTEIRNGTKDPELNGVTELFRNELLQSAYFNLVSDGQIRETLERMVIPPDHDLDPVTARGIAWRNAAPLVVYGKIASFGPEHTLSLHIEKVGADPNHALAHWSKAWRVSGKTEIFDAVRDASRWVRQTVGEASKDIADADRPPQDITTDSWEALRLLSAAVKERQSDQQQEAVALLKEAVLEDPQFALAYMMLGDTYDSLGQYNDSYDAYQKALTTLSKRRLDKREELRIRGLAAWEVQDYKASEAAFSTYTALYPNDDVGWFYRAHPLVMLGNPEQAITVLREAARLRPSAARVFGHLAKDNLIVGNFAEAEQNIARLRALGSRDDADLYEGQLSFLTEQYQKAETLLVGLQRGNDPEVRSIGYSVLACLLAELGRYSEAIGIIQHAIKEDTSTGNFGARADHLLVLASLYSRVSNKADSRKACLDALGLDPSLPHALSAGTILARSGFLADAQNALVAVRSQNYPPFSDVVRHRLTGEIALSTGQKEQALSEFGKANAVEAPAHARDYLARALLASDKPSEAFALYGKIAGLPGQIWLEPQAYEPGFFANILFQYGKLGVQLDKADGSDALVRYLKMREHGDKDLIEIKEARALLNRSRATRDFGVAVRPINSISNQGE